MHRRQTLTCHASGSTRVAQRGRAGSVPTAESRTSRIDCSTPTDRAFRLLVSEHWVAGIFRTRIIAKVAAFAMLVERARRLAFRTLSQIGIYYRSSRLSEMLTGVPQQSPRAGDRFPWLRLKFATGGPLQDLFETLDDTRFNLIVSRFR
jgi:hypothetical protein